MEGQILTPWHSAVHFTLLFTTCLKADRARHDERHYSIALPRQSKKVTLPLQIQLTPVPQRYAITKPTAVLPYHSDPPVRPTAVHRTPEPRPATRASGQAVSADPAPFKAPPASVRITGRPAEATRGHWACHGHTCVAKTPSFGRGGQRFHPTDRAPAAGRPTSARRRRPGGHFPSTWLMAYVRRAGRRRGHDPAGHRARPARAGRARDDRRPPAVDTPCSTSSGHTRSPRLQITDFVSI